jgi:methyl-accepting chemotaxis protein
MGLFDRLLPGFVRRNHLRTYAVVSGLIVLGGGVLTAVVPELNPSLLVGYFAAGFVFVGATLQRSTVGAITDLQSKTAALGDADQLTIEDIETDISIDRDDEIGELYDGFADMSETLKQKIRTVESARERAYQERQELEEARKEATAAKQRAEELNEHLEEKAQSYQSVMEATARGDLTQRMDTDSESPAMTAIGETFNTTMSQLQQTLADTVDFSTSVATSTKQIAVTAGEINETSDDVNASVQEIAADARTQDETLQQANDEVNDVSATIQEVAASAKEVAAVSETAATLGEDGRDGAQAAVDQIADIRETAKQTIERVEQLEAEIEQISEIVGLINDIADQTNMLALNASIEAARADQSGDGFTVVADEVKALAAETNQATGDVRDRIQRVESVTEAVAENVQTMDERIADGSDTVRETRDVLEEIVDQVQEADDGVQSITDATDAQARSVQQLVGMVDDLSDISRETVQKAESVASATQQQTAAITEVSDGVQSLSSQAVSLNETLSTFTVEGESGPTGAGTQTPGPSVDAQSANSETGAETAATDRSANGTTGEKSDTEASDTAGAGIDVTDDELPEVELSDPTPENAEKLFE